MYKEEPPTCSCESCKDLCRRSCWPTPLEASTLIGLGYGPRMMLDYWQGSPSGKNFEDVYVVCGAEKGLEGRFTGSWQMEPCTFFNKKGLCEIHDICKPLEGRMATCDESFKKDANLHKEIAIMWESWEGERVTVLWEHSLKVFEV